MRKERKDGMSQLFENLERGKSEDKELAGGNCQHSYAFGDKNCHRSSDSKALLKLFAIVTSRCRDSQIRRGAKPQGATWDSKSMRGI